MKLLKKIDVLNILIDVIITLFAIQFLDISALVEKTLPVTIYFVIFIQSFTLLLLLGDESIDENLETSKITNRAKKLEIQIKLWLRGFAMFSWLIGPLWIIIPLDYLKGITGETFAWASRISFIVGIFAGLVLLVRFFANSSANSEKEHLITMRNTSFENKTWAEAIIIPIYEFIFYQNIRSPFVRSSLIFTLTLGYLVYTETLFEILVNNSSTETFAIILGIFGSYFPIRMLLLLKSPFSFLEVISAITAFGIFIYMLFA